MKKYSLLVFDWDGTLFNSKDLLIEALQKTASDFNYQMPEVTTISKYFGFTVDDIIQHLFPKGNHTELIAKFYDHFITEENIVKNFFSGTIETLNYLKQRGFILAIATNAARIKLNASLDVANIKNFFAATRCPEDAAPKPAPDMLLTLLEELRFIPQDVLMIGDTVTDMQFAKNAAVDALAVCYGNNKKDQLAVFNPINFIDDIQELRYIF
jgi:phosphoglycolate phosphatase